MFTKNAEAMLQDYQNRSYQKDEVEVNDRIVCYVGWGHSNAIAIEGDTSLILVDTLDSDERAKRLRGELETRFHKPVKTIIYTHGHPDHRGGSGAFRDVVEEVIAFAPKHPVLKYTERLQGVLGKRTMRQFGYELNDEENLSQGLGKREGKAVSDGTYDMLPPTTIYTEDRVERVIDGVRLELISAVGETDDQIFVWLPDDKVICCGDNYYGCFPNLYAIRGSQYRDVASWADSVKTIRSYGADAVLPGHTRPLLGAEVVQEMLGNYADAIESVLLQTLDYMNQGMTESEVVEAVELPQKYRDLPYFGEFYGTVEWTVRAIFHGYVGWFDGEASHLCPLPDHVFAKELVKLSGVDQIFAEAEEKLKEGAYQMAIQLCDLLILAETEKKEQAKQLKAKGLMELSHLITSPNGRHYYMVSAKELMRSQN